MTRIRLVTSSRVPFGVKWWWMRPWVSDFKGMRQLGVRKVQHCHFSSACSIITIECRIHFRSESNLLFSLSDLDDEVTPHPPLEGLKPESQICTQMGTDERSHSPLCCFSNGRWKFFRAMAKVRKVNGPELHGKRTFLRLLGLKQSKFFLFFLQRAFALSLSPFRFERHPRWQSSAQNREKATFHQLLNPLPPRELTSRRASAKELSDSLKINNLHTSPGLRSSSTNMTGDHAAPGHSPPGAPVPPSRRIYFGPRQPMRLSDLDAPTSLLLPVREALMMYFMDRLTNVAGWHTKVFDDEYLAYWRSEVPSWARQNFALSQALPTELLPTMSKHPFDFVCFKSHATRNLFHGLHADQRAPTVYLRVALQGPVLCQDRTGCHSQWGEQPNN